MSPRDPNFLRHKLKLSPRFIHAFFDSDSNEVVRCGNFVANSLDTFALSFGSDRFPNAKIASTVASTNTIWSINLLKAKHSYWRDKKAMGGRIVRSVNLSLYNKRREGSYVGGIGASLAVLLFGERNFYVYGVGNIRIFILRNREIKEIHTPNNDLLGIQKKAPDFTYYTDLYYAHDLFVLFCGGSNASLKRELKGLSKIPIYSEELLITKLSKFIENVRLMNRYCGAGLIHSIPGEYF